MPTTPAPNHCPPGNRPELLRGQAESLIRALSGEDAVVLDASASSRDLIVDGYAHALALEVDCLKIERQIVQLAESGDPDVAGELRELSGLLRSATRICKRLRDVLSCASARAELR